MSHRFKVLIWPQPKRTGKGRERKASLSLDANYLTRFCWNLSLIHLFNSPESYCQMGIHNKVQSKQFRCKSLKVPTPRVYTERVRWLFNDNSKKGNRTRVRSVWPSPQPVASSNKPEQQRTKLYSDLQRWLVFSKLAVCYELVPFK